MAQTWSYIHKLKLSAQWSPFPGFAGGTTDEDSYPSSGSESRESSAGSIRSLNPIMPQHPPPSTPQLLRDARRRATKRNVLSSLVVDIPQTGEHGGGPNSARLPGGGGHTPGATFGLTSFVAASVADPGSPSFSCTDRERTPVLFVHWQREDTCPFLFRHWQRGDTHLFDVLAERGHLSSSCTDRKGTSILFMYWQEGDTCPFHALTERGHLSFSCTDRERTPILFMYWQKGDTHPFHALTERTPVIFMHQQREDALFMHWQKEDTCPFHALAERGHPSFSCTDRERKREKMRVLEGKGGIPCLLFLFPAPTPFHC